MGDKMPTRHDVIIAGIGGTGSMIIGQILASAGVTKYKYTLWNPSMTTARRGAPADCTVVLSDEKIGSPLFMQAQTVIMTESSRLNFFEKRVLQGGTLIIETSGLKETVKRDDIRTIEIPGVTTAAKIGNALARNMVLLGAYIKTINPLTMEAIEKEITTRFEKNNAMLTLNIKAFQKGAEIVAKAA